jgi:hypothetical protein
MYTRDDLKIRNSGTAGSCFHLNVAARAGRVQFTEAFKVECDVV